MKFDLLYHLISPVTGKLKILLNLGNGLLKTTNDGELSIAIPDEDFATSTTLEQIKSDTEQIKSDTEFYRTEAQIASGTATNAASVATTAAGEASIAAGEASIAAIDANTSMLTATGAAISAAASAQSASNSANSAADSAAQAVQNIPTFNYPLLKTTNTLSCLYDNLTIGLDASNRLKVISGSSQWTTSGSNIYYNVTGGGVGIGTATPSSSYKLDVNGNINCTEIYRSGISLTTTLGTKQNTLIATTDLLGVGTSITALNATNITSGTLSTAYGGTGVTTGLTVLNPANLSSAVTVDKGGTGATTLTSGQLLIGNGTTAVLQSANLAWDNTTNTLSATNISGSGTGLTALNATNITSGTLSTAYGGTGVTTGLTVLNPANLSSAVTVAKGGTGATTLTSGQLLIGNGTTAVLQSANLAWDNTTNTLSATNISGSGTGLTALNATNITSGTLSTTYGGTGVTTGLTVLNPANLSSAVTVAKGGTGATTLTSGRLLIGNGTAAVLQSANLAWNNTTNTLSATNISGNGTGLTALNPANLSSAVTVAKGGTGATTLTSGQLLIGNGTTAVLQSANLAWDNTTNTLSATNIVGNGSGITGITGASLTGIDYNNLSNKLTFTSPLSINASNAVSIDLSAKQNTLTAATNLLGIGTSITALNATNITSGTLSTTYGGTGVTTGLTVLNPANLSSAVTVDKGGTGATTLTSGQLLIGNGTAAVLQSANLAWNNISNVLNVSSNININGNVNQPQSLQFRGTDYNLGIAGAAGHYSSSAVQNDMILRTLSGTNLILQSGAGSSALKINNNNYVAFNKILQLSVVPADNRTVAETTIINNGGVVGGAFGGDTYLSSYWGVAIGLNSGGWTDGIGGGNNTQSIIPGQSAFTVNLRSSASSTSFDKTLFAVLPSGNVTCTGYLTSSKYYVNGEDYSFNSNWNGTGAAGWFVSLNQYWYTGHAYLTVAIYAKNVAGSNAYCWFGRVFCSVNTSGTGTPPANNGGIIQIITDYRNPTTSAVNNNFINVKEKWDGNGNNMLWIEINNFNFAGTMHVKIYG